MGELVVTPCPMCWMGRHTHCTGVFALADGSPTRCTCKQADHQTPTKPATPVVTVDTQIRAIQADLNRVLDNLDRLLENHDAATS